MDILSRIQILQRTKNAEDMIIASSLYVYMEIKNGMHTKQIEIN